MTIHNKHGKTSNWALVAMMERNCLTMLTLSNNGHAT